MESNLVIKVKYGDTLRRFNAPVDDENNRLDLDMAGLRAKIISLFNFPSDAELTLTYIDEDGDVVALVDDEDLFDVMRQRLKFLRIDVQLSNDKFAKSNARSSGNSTPLRSPRIQHLLPTSNTSVADILKYVPEPLLETLSKVSLDFASKASSSSPVFADLVECLSKMRLSNVISPSQCQAGDGASMESASSEGHNTSPLPTDPNPSKDGRLRVVLPNSTSIDSASKASQDAALGNVKEAPVITGPAAVDLNRVPSGNDNINSEGSSGHRKDKHVGFVGSNGLDGHNRNSTCDSANVLGFTPPNECPFGGMPVVSRFCDLGQTATDGMSGAIFHRGVQCDNCGVHPITGTRFKSIAKENYDLCSICFSKMGKESDYVRMDRPMPYRPSRCFKMAGVNGPAIPHIMRSRMRAARPKLDSRFILDVNVLDGTVMAPSTPFTKIWRMRNCGTLPWPRGVLLVYIGGDKFSTAEAVGLEIPADGIPVEGELDIAVDFTAPELPGRYVSYWRMVSPSGVKFGQRVWVLIQVDASLKEPIHVNHQGLNLNLPPGSSCTRENEFIDMNVDLVTDAFSPENTNAITEPMKPTSDQQPKNDQVPNFSMKDGLLAVNGVPVSASPQASSSSSVAYPIIDHGVSVPAVAPSTSPSSVSYPIIDHGVSVPAVPAVAPSTSSYPIIDLTDASAAGPSHVLYPAGGAPVSSQGATEADVEQSLLKELEEMGFKQVDLNKEILRMNEYDLEKCVEDLCGVAEWDPILEELKEMGFSDAETNKKLLKKNNGSIKRVVMDLLTGEKP